MKIIFSLIWSLLFVSFASSQSLEMRKLEVKEAYHNNRPGIEFTYTFVVNGKKDIELERYLNLQYKGERKFVGNKNFDSGVCRITGKITPQYEGSIWSDSRYFIFFENMEIPHNNFDVTAFIGVENLAYFWVDFRISYTGIKNLAVLNFANHSRYQGAGNKIADIMTNKIMKNGKYSVFDRMSISRLMHENQIGYGYISDYDAIRIGGLANVDAVIVGNVYEYGVHIIDNRVIKGDYYIGRYVKKEAIVQLDFKVINIKSQKVIASHNITGKSYTDGFTDFDQINDITLSKYSYNDISDEWKHSNDQQRGIIILGSLLEASAKNKELKIFKTRMSSDFEVLSAAEKDAMNQINSFLNFGTVRYTISNIDYSRATGKKP